MRLMIATTVMATMALTPLLAADQEPAKRLDAAATVFSEVMATPDKGIPQELLETAHCIVIVPDLKSAAFGVGGKYGKGYLSCRSKTRAGWSAPATVRIEGGSVGFQIGASSTDLIMLVMTERGADKLLASKFTLGAEGSVAAGPVGRTATAQTDVQMQRGHPVVVAIAGVVRRRRPHGGHAARGSRRQRHAVWQEDRKRDDREHGRARPEGGRQADVAAEPVLGQGTHAVVSASVAG